MKKCEIVDVDAILLRCPALFDVYGTIKIKIIHNINEVIYFSYYTVGHDPWSCKSDKIYHIHCFDVNMYNNIKFNNDNVRAYLYDNPIDIDQLKYKLYNKSIFKCNKMKRTFGYNVEHVCVNNLQGLYNSKLNTWIIDPIYDIIYSMYKSKLGVRYKNKLYEYCIIKNNKFYFKKLNKNI